MIRVLVVDDDKLARQGIIALLPWKKYQMEVVGDVQNGREALRFLQENDTDLVL
ncbi:MAG: response regulator [Lachnospiraceae bacterium]|nr:response regulator [Lachnospiraceae bacterium]